MLKLFCTWVVALTALTASPTRKMRTRKPRKERRPISFAPRVIRFNLACTFRGQAWRGAGVPVLRTIDMKRARRA
jgi:hypothetical protein